MGQSTRTIVVYIPFQYVSSLGRNLQTLNFALAPPPADQKDPVSPKGSIPQPFSYEFSKVVPTPLDGGKTKVTIGKHEQISDMRLKVPLRLRIPPYSPSLKR